MIKEDTKEQQRKLEQIIIPKQERKTARGYSSKEALEALRIKRELSHLRGQEEYYELRKRWARFLCGTSLLMTFLIFTTLFLKGFKYIEISDYIMGGLIAIGAIDNTLNRFVTKFLFPQNSNIHRDTKRNN